MKSKQKNAAVKSVNDDLASPSKIPFKLGFNREEAAAILGISKDSLDRLVKRNLIRPSRALRTPRFSSDELRRFLNDTQI